MRRAVSKLVLYALASLVACSVGCQFSDFSRGRSDEQLYGDEDVSRLSGRQVADARVALARSMERRGEVDRAVDAYREILEKSPQQATACWRMAILSDRSGNVQESEGYYRRALKAEPKNPDFHCDFGYSLYLQRRWAESEDHLRQAIAIKDGHRRAHNNLGLLLAQTERNEEALAEFRKSGCPEAEARANLAFLLTLNRRWDEARGQYELALQANPELAAARTGLQNLEKLVAHSAAASSDVRQANYETPANATSVAVPPAMPAAASRAQAQ